MEISLEQKAAVVRRVYRRLIPFLFALYVFAYLDRVNVGYAALTIRRDLHFTDTVYGTGGGLFFLSYALFEVPANLILLRLGPRRWIALIMTVWGIISASMPLVHSAAGFYLLRFLLGAAEAGFFPGILLYLTYWFPPEHRARAVAQFMTATAVAGIIGAPLSTALLALNGILGIAGWKWLFLGEGIPSIFLGLTVLWALNDKPADATWLEPAERTWLTSAVSIEPPPGQSTGNTLIHAFAHPLIWMLASVYFAISVGLYSLSLWLPVMLKGLSKSSDLRVVALSTIPYVFAAVAMLLIARSSDRTGERHWHLIASLLLAAVSFALSAFLTNPLLAIAALCFSAAGIWGCFGPFWALPTANMRGRAVAGGIALINSIGALGGFCGPYLMGRVSDLTHSFHAALYVAGALLLANAMLVTFVHKPAPTSPSPSA
jgi:ACS family tartrate transporter-like MFS transporter